MANEPIRIKIRSVQLRMIDMKLRIAFKFGIATLTQIPQLTMRIVAEDESGRTATGYSADVLPALWFDKASDKSIDQKIEDQITMARLAGEFYLDRASRHVTPFDLWWSVYPELKREAERRGINALTAGFGSSFAERAGIDAACRLAGVSFFEASRANLFGIEPYRVHHELAGFDPGSVFGEKPLSQIWCRHTVGLGDKLRAADLKPEDRLNDGLPQTLEDDIAAYGHRYFKIKIGADRDWNIERLTAIAALLEEKVPDAYYVTMDGNEQVQDLEDLHWLLGELEARPACRRLRKAILFIEQPLSRDVALREETEPAMRKFAKTCPVIIDESDNDVTSLTQARDIGYSGVSVKNCKGVFKAILNRCLLVKWAAEGPAAQGQTMPTILSSEDLTNAGVIALQQDLATLSSLGIRHSERNGHHYYKGLSYLSEKERRSALEHHGDLYEEKAGTVALRIRDGIIRFGSIHAAGYGYSSAIDFESRMTIDEWREKKKS